MRHRIIGALFGAAIGAIMATGAAAQSSGESECVSAKTDWSVCVWPNPSTAQKPTECWGVSKPKETVNTRDGRAVSVRRGDILMFVTFRPGSGANGEVSFSGGYPFAPGAPVVVEIDGQSFNLVVGTEGVNVEWAWPADATADAALLAAMKRGAQAVVTARSGRGTETKDTFSLQGFTAAMTEAEARCK